MKSIWILLGGYTLAWGFWIGNPFWTSFTPEAGLYDEMAEFMPEWAWGLHAVIVGVAILYGTLYRWPRGLAWGRISATYHWGIVAWFYAFGDIKNTGMITAIALVVLIQLMWKLTPRTPVIHPFD